MAYIRTALAHESPIIFIQIEQDGKILKETFCSVYPRACGMFFHKKQNDYAITLTNGRFIPPPEGWRGTIFYPLYDEDENEDDDEDDSYEEDDDYCSDDGYQHDVGAKPPEKEDFNMLYNHLLRDDQNDDSYDSYDD